MKLRKITLRNSFIVYGDLQPDKLYRAIRYNGGPLKHSDFWRDALIWRTNEEMTIFSGVVGKAPINSFCAVKNDILYLNIKFDNLFKFKIEKESQTLYAVRCREKSIAWTRNFEYL